MNAAIPIIGISAWVIVKIFILIGLLLYSVFAFVMVKQTKLMAETFIIRYSSYVRLLVYLHMAFSVFAFILALIIL